MRGLAAIVMAGVLVGCSQVDALAPVGGNHLAEVRFAAIDLLVSAQVDILTAPVCEMATGGAISCVGSTLGGEAIAVDSTAEDPLTVTVRVGSDVLYSGSIQEVLESAARATE